MRTTALLLLLLCSVASAVDRDVKFCNEYPRVSSTLLAHSYYSGKRLVDQWNATAADDRMTVLGSSIIQQAELMRRTMIACRATDDQWWAEGATSLVPNNSDPIVDGAPADGRPQITGSQVITNITRAIEYRNWLDHGEYVTTVVDSDNGAYRHAILAVSMSTPDNLDLTQATTVITRCQQLAGFLESDGRLGSVLSVAVIGNEEIE